VESSKLIRTLKTFSKKELRKFGEFVNSPYYNKNADIIKLFEELAKYYPRFTGEALEIENVYKKIFPKQKYDYHKISNLNSDLYQLAKEYLKQVAFRKKEIEADIWLLIELHERKLDIPYSQEERAVSKHIHSLKVRDENYYSLLHGLNKINTSHFKFEKSKYAFNSIQREFDSFFKYSLVGLLKHYSKMLHNRNHGNINFNMEMFERVLEYIKDKDFAESPSCMVYRQIILLELNREENDYRKLLELKGKFENNLSVEDIYYILLVMNSFAVYRLKLGDEKYYKDRFLTFKEIAERDFFPSEIIFPNFITTFTAACNAGELDWAEEYSKRFRDGIVPKEEKQNTLTYCEAFLAYTQKDNAKALELFAQTNFKLFLFKVMVKSYMLRIYYEEEMHEQALTAIDAFRHYLKSEKLIADTQKEAHYEFLKYVAALSRLRLEGVDKAELMSLRKQIQNMPHNPMGIKNWLLRKVGELVR
jgi:hypothetical protein